MFPDSLSSLRLGGECVGSVLEYQPLTEHPGRPAACVSEGFKLHVSGVGGWGNHTGSRENHSEHNLHLGDRCQVERMHFGCPQAGDGSPFSLANSRSDFGDSSLPAVGAGRERTLQNKNNGRKPPNRSEETGNPVPFLACLRRGNQRSEERRSPQLGHL